VKEVTETSEDNTDTWKRANNSGCVFR